MVTTAISFESASPVTVAAPDGTSSVALQYQLARCTRQLGDWVACPSSTTAEGKKIIEDLRARIGNIESRLGASSRPAPMPKPSSPASARLSTLGSLVNAFA